MSTIRITNHFHAPIGQHIDHVDKIEAHFDKDMGMHIEVADDRSQATGDSTGGNEQSEGDAARLRLDTIEGGRLSNVARFRYISPFVTEDEEREKIHRTVVNLVTSGFRLSAICKQLNELIKEKKIAMYVSTTDQYNELVRLGLPKDKGNTQKNYENYMSEQKK